MFLYESKRLAVKPMLTPHYSTGHSIYYALIDKESIEEVGYICFQSLDGELGTANLAYRTYTDFQGKGYMKEVLAGVVDAFFAVFPLITLHIEIKKDNIASLATIKHISGLIDKTKKTVRYEYSKLLDPPYPNKVEEDPEYFKYIKRKGI